MRTCADSACRGRVRAAPILRLRNVVVQASCAAPIPSISVCGRARPGSCEWAGPLSTAAALRHDVDDLADDLAAVINHFGLRGVTLASHSLGSREAVRYLIRHGDARVGRLVLVAPTTLMLRRTADNPSELAPAVIDASYPHTKDAP
jgi:pimeloyl-ACP methyl ester carboxylesterase